MIIIWIIDLQQAVLRPDIKFLSPSKISKRQILNWINFFSFYAPYLQLISIDRKSSIDFQNYKSLKD